MSVSASAWAWHQQAKCSPNAGKVLLALADHADDLGVCWPGLVGVAEKCGVSELTVRRKIKELDQAGLLKKEERYDPNGRQTSNIYILPLAEGEGVNLIPRPITSDRGRVSGVIPLESSLESSLKNDHDDSIREDDCRPSAGGREIDKVVRRLAHAIKNGKGPAVGHEAAYLGRALHRNVPEVEAAEIMARVYELAGAAETDHAKVRAAAEAALEKSYAASEAAAERQIAEFRARPGTTGVVPELATDEVAS